MLWCGNCDADLQASQRFCASCGAPADLPPGGATRSAAAAAGQHRRSAPSDPGGRILPGTLVAGRFRVVSLVGRGGMGEVYRADDLKLGQPVALKFLPRSVERDSAWLSRLLDEVRIARQISHPNVCRVYDVGEAEGRHFLSMEFIDGEDLASLLRRIGRIPPEKALQIARQLCAGLAAAHEQAVLHRDLKPANVMIDGRGRARITDFGLAGLQEAIPAEEIRAGTPAYMAPEQLEGREVTVRSDVYALGLILYEIFAGRHAFDAAGSLEELRRRRSDRPATPSSHVEGLDPGVERAILRCLDPDSSLRPWSALAVAAALPGGDPLAAALAAGETPSPDVVAAAPAEGRLRPSAAGAALLAAVMLWGVSIVLATRILGHLSFERSPQGLADRARDLLERVGHSGKPVDSAWGYLADEDLLVRLSQDPPSGLVEAAKAGQAPVVRFWYRDSPEYLMPHAHDRVTLDDPPPEAPGARQMEMTTDGRLVAMRVVPPAAGPANAGARVPDWAPLFEAAGLDLEAFETAPPSTPPDFADTQSAWGAKEGPAGARLRVDAAALGGVPVFFAVAPELQAANSPPPAAATLRIRVFFLLLGILFSSVLVAALWLARRNFVSGRGDRTGANRIAAVVLAVSLVSWVLSASHAPALGEFLLFFRSLALALLEAAIVWILYVALEPLLRRRSPGSLVSWTRLLAGRVRDPLVGRDLLLGSACGGLFVCFDHLADAWAWAGGHDPVPAPETVHYLTGLGGLMASLDAVAIAFVQGMGYAVLWQLFSRGLRSSVRGAFALGALLIFGLSVKSGLGWFTLFVVLQVAVLVFTISRLGLLASVTLLWMMHIVVFFPVSSDPSAWFAGESAFAFGLGALPAVWGAWVSAARVGSVPG